MSSTVLRRPLRVALAVATGATALVAFSAPAQAAVPSDCYAGAYGVTDGRVLFHREFNPKGTKTYSRAPLQLPWLPRSVANTGGYGDTGYSQVGYLMLAEDAIQQVTIVSKKVDGQWKRSLTSRVVRSSMASLRKLVTTDGRFAYGLTNAGGLRRFRLTWNDGKASMPNAGTISKTGWDSIRNLTFARTINWGRSKADVLSATTSGGSLREFVIPRKNPSAVKRHTLRAKGWGHYQSLDVERCGSGKDYVYVGIRTNGDAYRFYDRNGRDFSGKNLRADGLRVAGLSHTHFDG